ncbi:hypothetical protein [Paenibacillus hexagrammi]|uniref:FTP domain-containing protein n=1 Tax=Paenibacillus hexagrammi TaxID=2908839 RepID=A0ABY3SLL5_9BACL|nr:hypothetical protein [Paenibacillus sp. YPD9-1]UJF33852.1 hypothetical protein L0M14_00880 [Paenibacillus sp. YPD9-1]
MKLFTRKRGYWLGASLVAASSIFLAAAGVPKDAPGALRQLQGTSGQAMKIEWNEATGTPAALIGNLTVPSKHSVPYIAYELMDRLKNVYGIRDPHKELRIAEVVTSAEGVSFVRLQHLLFGTPVWGDELIMEIDTRGVVKRLTGTIYPSLNKQLFNRPMVAAISKQQALQRAALSSPHQLAAFTDSKPEVSAYYLPTRSGTPLVYVVTFSGAISHSAAQPIMIHALTGNVISLQTR